MTEHQETYEQCKQRADRAEAELASVMKILEETDRQATQYLTERNAALELLDKMRAALSSVERDYRAIFPARLDID